MEIIIDAAGKRRRIPVQPGQTVLEALQGRRIDVQAACGGVGTCGRCQVLVRDASGVGFRLACATEVQDGMEVVVERARGMEVVHRGMAHGFSPDAGAVGYGMAVDVGTTTLVAHLHDLASGERLATADKPNPQIVFGSDVVSRIFASMNGKLGLMADAIRDALVEMRGALCAQAGIDVGDVVATSIAGNTVMQHIVAGLAPDSIGTSPFAPQSLFGDVRDVPGLGQCRFARCVAGYVGGDITAGMTVRRFDEGGTRLFVDLGTNGEMALAHGGRTLCCATAAGPVFEGAGITFGMPASPGAISQVSLEGGALRVQVIGGGDPIGVCGTGLVDAVALMVDAGIVDETGLLLGPGETCGPMAERVGTVDGAAVFYLDVGRSVYITQRDVRNLQLAKGAVCAGILTLAETAGISLGDISSLEIAGGFGTYLDLGRAARIGLFPAQLLPRARSVGNTAAEGASALLVSGEARALEAKLAEACEYLELSTSPLFNEHFMQELGIKGGCLF